MRIERHILFWTLAAVCGLGLIALLRDAQTRERMGHAAWERAARTFRVADMVDAHLTLYRDVLETERP